MSQDKNLLPQKVSFGALLKLGTFKTYLAVSTLCIIALAIAWAYMAGLHKNELLRSQALGNQLELSNHDKMLLLQLFEVDEKVIFEGNYTEALQEYKTIYDNISDFAKPQVSGRIEKIQELIQNLEGQNQENVNKDLLLAQNRKKLIELSKELEETREKQGEELAKTKEQLRNTREELDKKERQLNRKERIQVLSFNGQKGAKIHYLGEVVEGKAQGGGMGIWTTGSIYRGEWKDNKRHGKGTFEWADGEKYEGDYNNDIREGTGTYYWPSGERYEGGWANNMRQGEGKLYDKDGNISYSGLWDKDKPAK